jgi:uncharacterized protein YegP (UPF0339 family)
MRVDVYQDSAGGWRWRLRASNGKIIADGAEGYSARRKLLDALERLLGSVDDGGVVNALDAVLTRFGR